MRRPLIACKRSHDFCQKDGTGLVAVRAKAAIGSISLAMRITAAILLIGALQVNARGVAQKVSITGTNLPLTAVFHAIEDQTGYGVLMEKSTLEAAKPVTINLTNGTIDDVMKVCFSFQPWKLIYTISGRTISVSRIVGNTETGKPGGPIAPSEPSFLLGKVKTEGGVPLSGASVNLKGTRKGGVTDNNGNFSLQGIRPGKYILEISYVGYDTYEETIEVTGSAFTVTAVMREATNSLDQVQVIPYGSTTPRLNTGNVTTIKASDIEKQPVNNPLVALEGLVPGLFITQANGLPGAGATVRIEGQNSIDNGNDPLYIIDGVPYVSQTLPTTQGGVLGMSGPSLGGGGGAGNPLSYINPSEIESIDILKDAAATSIYGSRAGNGAILITTKKGKIGQMKVDLNLQEGIGKMPKKIAMLNTPQYLAMRHEALRNDGIASPSFTDYDINGFWDTTRNTDWQKVLLGGTAQYTNIDGSVSGGTANTQYRIGGTYHRETTIFPGHFSDQKASVHFNLNSISPNQKFQIQVYGNYLNDNNRLPAADLTGSAFPLPPDAPPLYKSDGSINWALNQSGASSWNNPVAALLSTYENNTENLISNCILSYKLLPGLEIKSDFGYTRLYTKEFTAIPLTVFQPEILPYVQRSALYSNNDIKSWIIEPQISYNRAVGNGRLNILLGSTFDKQWGMGDFLTGLGYNSDGVLQDIHSASSVLVNSTASYVYKYNAIFGRVNFDWQNKFLINLTARRDGSSNFGSKNQFHDFGAAGVGWIFSNESIFKRSIPFLSFGKIRASYGTTGNDQIGNYKYLNLYQPVTAGVAYQGATGLAVQGLSNPYLQWEATKKASAGIELGFIKDRILINATYSRNRSSNQLLQYSLPVITGSGGVSANLPATVQNSTWEFSMNTINVKAKYFQWRTSINFTIPKNTLLSFPNLNSSTYASFLALGEPLKVNKVFHSLGVDPTTGIYIFQDLKGNSTNSPDFTTDRMILVNTDPKFYGGMQNVFTFKGFRLDFFFQFVKQLARTATKYSYAGTFPPGHKKFNQPTIVLDRWQKPGDVSMIQKFSSTFEYYTPFSSIATSDAIFGDGAYFRLRNLSLSYQFDQQWLKNSGMNSCRIYVEGQNLFTVTKYYGLNPETQAINLPPLRMIIVGLDLGF